MANEKLNGEWQRRRLAEIQKYPLDLEVPDPFLDGIAAQMLALCNTTSVIISFFGDQPSLVKARAGELFVPNAKTMFCDLVLHLGGYVEVEDTLSHSLFKHNPQVLGNPVTRFFSSTPLVNREGFVLGSLCALNRKPLRFTPGQRKEIAHLSAKVMDYLESRRKH